MTSAFFFFFYTNIYPGPYVEELQEVDLEVQSQDFCMQHYYPDDVTDNMLCAGPLEGGKGVCEVC